MPAEDFTHGQSGQQDQLNDVACQEGQEQPQSESALPSHPLDADSDSGTEALTGSAPHEGNDDGKFDNAGTDNFAPPAGENVEVVESDSSIEPAGSADSGKGNGDLVNAPDEVESGDTEDVDGDGI